MARGGGWGWGVGVGVGWGVGGGGGGVGVGGGGGGGVGGWGGGGCTRVHHGRVGSAGLCDLKILHPWRRLKKGSKFYNDPPNARNGGQYSTSVWKVCKKGGQKSTILKIWGSKFYKSENGGQNSTCWKIGVKILQCLKKGGSIFYIRPQKQRSKFYIGWKRGDKRAEPTRYPKYSEYPPPPGGMDK